MTISSVAADSEAGTRPKQTLRFSAKSPSLALLVSGLLLAATLRVTANEQAHADISIYGVGTQCPFAKVGVALSCRVAADAYPPRTLSFRLKEGPVGLEIGEKTGDLTWLPTLKQLGRHKVTVSARDDAGATVSDTSWILVLLPPPADFRGERTSEGLHLSWTPVPGAVVYRIRRLNSGDRVAEVAGTTYLDTATVPTEDSSYAINAVDSLGQVGGDEWLHLPKK